MKPIIDQQRRNFFGIAAGTVAAHLAETPPSWDMVSRL